MSDKYEITKETEFVYENRGFGAVSYEEGSDFIEKKDGRVYTYTFSKNGMEWSDEEGAWVYDGGIGMKSKAILKSDLTEEQLGQVL